jgi:putative membrane protein
MSKLDESHQSDKTRKQDARFHLANERTLLAWIRTSIGIMAFGFVVVKFSLFLKQLAWLVGKEVAIPTRGYSTVVGILLVGVGAVVLLLAYVKYKQTERKLLDDSFQPSSKLAFILTATILVTSLLLIFYLIETSM